MNLLPIFRFIFKWIFLVLPFFLFSIFLITLGIFFFLKEEIHKESIVTALPVSKATIAYPVLTFPPNIKTSARAAIVMDNDSKVVIYAKNPTVRFSPASTTKIMTALVGFDHYQLTDSLIIKNLDTEGKPVGFIPGQQYSFEDLLYAMLLPSSNDAALAVADNYPGGRKTFVSKMNEKAGLFHLQNTHFADPIGLEDDQDYTTVTELARLSSIAMENPVFANIVKQKYATISPIGSVSALPLKNINELLGSYGINGIKTGFTDGAKEVLATSVIRNNHSYIIVVMDSDDRFADTLQLITNILPNINYSLLSL